MNRNLIIFIGSTIIALVTIPMIWSQDKSSASHSLTIVFPEIALLDIESEEGNNLTFVMDATLLEAGEKLEVHEENDALWLNYTSVVGSGNT